MDIDFDEDANRERIARLRNAGVHVWSPERVFIGPEVRPDRIETGAILMNAVIRGQQTSIGSEAKIGLSGTAVVVNAQLGRAVELGAGWYEHSTLFDGAKVRGFAELRQGTVLEESAEAGHNVGLKHTFFTTGVVAGSCINFCDVLVTGGSSRQDHTEIGSGTVHFNFDPHGDKFGSLLGDARGLLLRQPRIFVGGNCGLVAPVHIGFGAVIAAGTTVRRDVESGRMYLGEAVTAQPIVKEFDPEVYFDLSRRFLNTAALAGSLQALQAWYKLVRLPCANGLERTLCEGALRNIRLHLEHRAREVDKMLSKPELAKDGAGNNPFQKQHHRLTQKRRQILNLLTRAVRTSPPPEFLRRYVHARRSADHGTAIREMAQKLAIEAEHWLSDTASQPTTGLSSLLR